MYILYIITIIVMFFIGYRYKKSSDMSAIEHAVMCICGTNVILIGNDTLDYVKCLSILDNNDLNAVLDNL